MKISLKEAFNLEAELYGLPNQTDSGESKTTFKGILQKGIPISAKIKIEQDLGSALRSSLEILRKREREIIEEIKTRFSKAIEEVQFKEDGEDKKVAFGKLEVSLHNEILKIKKEEGLDNLDQEIDIKDFTIDITAFEAQYKVNGEIVVENKLEGEEHYPIFSRFIKC